MALKLRGSKSNKSRKPSGSGGVSKEMAIQSWSKELNSKQMKGTERRPRVSKSKKVDRILSSQTRSDKKERKGVNETPKPTDILSVHGVGWECRSSKNPAKSSAINISVSDQDEEKPRTVLEMVTDAWNILDTDTSDVPQPKKLNLKAEAKEISLCVNVTTRDKSLQGSTLETEQGLGEGIQANRKERSIKLDSLKTSAVTAMHDEVIELVSSLKTRGMEEKLMSVSSDESESGKSDTDSDWNDESKETISGEKDQSTERKNRRAKRNTFCEICQKDFQNLPRHLFTHYGERSHKCKVCGKAFFEARVLDKHETTHTKKFKCGVCGEMFSKLRVARRHAKIHLPSKPYSCEICKQAFRTRSDVRNHLKIHSSRRFVCDICGQGKHSLNALNSHKRKHTGEKPYVCEICGKSFRYSSGLHVHNFSHTSGKPYSCPICRETFAHNYLRKRHLLTHKTDAVVSEKDSQGDVSLEADVQQNKKLIIQQLSPNSQDVATISQLGNMEQTLFLEEPLMQETNADQATCNPETDLPGPQSSFQNDQQTFANKARNINKVLGPDAFKQNLINGRGRRQTPVDSLVLPLCDGTYKSLKDLQRQGIESDDLPRH
ncbi:zinc finger and BTB domain-containing protein 49-like [Strongylocentrotus purpuratus]|nr:zinc finger and BTB domain-containing protein 49-like [Strongylocentrotus purpuratus]